MAIIHRLKRTGHEMLNPTTTPSSPRRPFDASVYSNWVPSLAETETPTDENARFPDSSKYPAPEMEQTDSRDRKPDWKTFR